MRRPGGGVYLHGAIAHLAEAGVTMIVSLLDSLIRIDTSDAEVHYVRGRLLDGLGRADEARRAYRSARNLDQLRFRAPDAINRIIREEAARTDARVVEVEGALRSASR